MAFQTITPRIRAGHGKHNITYRNGTFRLNKFTVESAGFPSHVGIQFDPESREVLVKPIANDDPSAHKLTSVGRTTWGNSFSSHELARRLNLPLTGQTIHFFTQWDEQHKALKFTAQPADKLAG